MGLILGIPLGCLAATRPGSLADRALGLVSIAFVAVPLVAILGLGLGDMISGAIFAEIIFARPGIGSLLSHAVSARNYPVVQAGSLLVVVFYIAANAAVDLLAALLDPRIAAAARGEKS